jgi:hypothetical protein
VCLSAINKFLIPIWLADVAKNAFYKICVCQSDGFPLVFALSLPSATSASYIEVPHCDIG